MFLSATRASWVRGPRAYSPLLSWRSSRNFASNEWHLRWRGLGVCICRGGHKILRLVPAKNTKHIAAFGRDNLAVERGKGGKEDVSLLLGPGVTRMTTLIASVQKERGAGDTASIPDFPTCA